MPRLIRRGRPRELELRVIVLRKCFRTCEILRSRSRSKVYKRCAGPIHLTGCGGDRRSLPRVIERHEPGTLCNECPLGRIHVGDPAAYSAADRSAWRLERSAVGRGARSAGERDGRQ